MPGLTESRSVSEGMNEKIYKTMTTVQMTLTAADERLIN
jgi:hypothetical protein